jgi:hypothetical protein
MKLVRRIPKLGRLPELLFYYCATCDAIETIEDHEPAPTRPPPPDDLT